MLKVIVDIHEKYEPILEQILKSPPGTPIKLPPSKLISPQSTPTKNSPSTTSINMLQFTKFHNSSQLLQQLQLQHPQQQVKFIFNDDDDDINTD